MSPIYALQITHHVKIFCLQKGRVLKDQGGKSHVPDTIWSQDWWILEWIIEVYTKLWLLNAKVISISVWEGLGSFMEVSGLSPMEGNSGDEKTHCKISPLPRYQGTLNFPFFFFLSLLLETKHVNSPGKGGIESY